MNPLHPFEDRVKARFEIFNEKRRRQIESVRGSALLPEEHEMILEDFLRITSIRRKNALPLFKVQLSMLVDLVTSEQAVTKYKKAMEERQLALRTDEEGGATQGEAQRFIEREIHFHQAICRALRDIADGIAWRLFDYDRFTLTMMANRPASKHINLSGLEAELTEFSHAFELRDGIAVFNDLTNFLKLADVTIRKDDGTFELLEVKTGHKSSGRITRQKQNLRRTLALINSGNAEEEEIIISQVDVKPEAYMRNISSLIKDAEKAGAATMRIGESMMVECTDFEAAGNMDLENIKSILDKGRECIHKWNKSGDLVIDLVSQDKYMDVKNYAPFSIYPLAEKTRVKLMIGSLFLVSYLNVSALLRYIQDRGWNVVKTPQEHAEENKQSQSSDEIWLATVRKGPLTTAIPFQLFGRIGFEFLKPKSLVDILEAHLSAGPTGAPKNFCNLSGEAELWD